METLLLGRPRRPKNWYASDEGYQRKQNALQVESNRHGTQLAAGDQMFTIKKREVRPRKK